jgi:hypothetical protein
VPLIPASSGSLQMSEIKFNERLLCRMMIEKNMFLA